MYYLQPKAVIAVGWRVKFPRFGKPDVELETQVEEMGAGSLLPVIAHLVKPKQRFDSKYKQTRYFACKANCHLQRTFR